LFRKETFSFAFWEAKQNSSTLPLFARLEEQLVQFVPGTIRKVEIFVFQIVIFLPFIPET